MKIDIATEPGVIMISAQVHDAAELRILIEILELLKPLLPSKELPQPPPTADAGVAPS